MDVMHLIKQTNLLHVSKHKNDVTLSTFRIDIIFAAAFDVIVGHALIPLICHRMDHVLLAFNLAK